VTRREAGAGGRPPGRAQSRRRDTAAALAGLAAFGPAPAAFPCNACPLWPAAPSSTAPDAGGSMTALLPAGPVPVPALAQPGGQRGPGHQVRRAGRDFLIASGATIALHRGGARHEPDHPVLAVPRLLDRRTESRRGAPGTSGGGAATAPARAATAGPAASSAREIVRQAAGLARAHGSHCPDPPEWNARPAVASTATPAGPEPTGMAPSTVLVTP